MLYNGDYIMQGLHVLGTQMKLDGQEIHLLLS